MNAARKPKRKKKTGFIDPGMKEPLIYSGIFHLLVLIIATVGFPFFTIREPEVREIAITVDLAELSDVSETNVVDKPNETEEPAPEPPKPEEQKPVYKQEEPEPEPEEAELPVPDDLLIPRKPEVEEVPEPPKPDEPKPEEVAQIKKPPKPTNKPKPPKPKPKEEKPKEEKPEEQEKDFSSLLKSLTPEQEEAPKPTDTPPTESKSEGQVSQIARFGANFTRSEEDDLNRGVQPCWNVNAGGKNAEQLIVSLRVYVNPDMTVREVDVLDDLRYGSDPHFRASADAARRALLNPTCRTLRLPPEKYEQWKVFQYDFDPSMML